MTPFSFEWHWNADYLIFMGLLYLALVIIGSGLVYTVLRTWMDLEAGEHETPPEIPYRKRYCMY
ncbi:MAG: hypothetical protein ACLFUE_06695 [Desulfobacteraceae bacterium]